MTEPTKEPRVTREWLEDCIDEMIQYHEDCQPTEDIRDAEHAKEVAVYRLALRALDAEQKVSDWRSRFMPLLGADEPYSAGNAVIMLQINNAMMVQKLADAERQTCDSCRYCDNCEIQQAAQVSRYQQFGCRAHQPKEPTR